MKTIEVARALRSRFVANIPGKNRVSLREPVKGTMTPMETKMTGPLGAILLAFVACSTEDRGTMKYSYDRSPDDAWHLKLSGLEQSREAELVGMLAAVPGVTDIALDGSSVKLSSSDGKLIGEGSLAKAASAVGADIDVILLPKAARVTVHTMTASGGG